VAGSSKAALNFILRKIHFEHASDNLVVLPIHPGLVATDMGKKTMVACNLQNIIISIEECVEKVLNIVDVATRETHGGKFLDYAGQDLVW
jgi:norsolorinic acid ketoreductase